MKICILPPDQKEPVLGHFTSGQERVARDQADILRRLGHDVDYWTVETKTRLGPHHKIMPNVRARSSFANPRGSGQVKAKKAWCEQWFDKYDLFLSHTDSGTVMKELTKLGVAPKIISFIHCNFAGTQWGIHFNSAHAVSRANGGKVVAVSERTKEHWNRWSRNTKGRMKQPHWKFTRPDLLHDGLVFEEYIKDVFLCQYATQTGPVNPGEYPIVLSRIAAAKKPHIAAGLEAIFLLRSDEKKYRAEIKKRLAAETVLIDLPYDECMDILSSASFLISTWTEEASSLAVFEAAERGIPSIVCERGLKAGCREYLPEWAYICCTDTEKAVHEAVSKIPDEWFTMEFREKLASYMRSNFSLSAYEERLEKIIQPTT